MPTFDEMVGVAYDKATAPPKKEKEMEKEDTDETSTLSPGEQKVLDAVKSGSAALKAAVKAAC